MSSSTTTNCETTTTTTSTTTKSLITHTTTLLDVETVATRSKNLFVNQTDCSSPRVTGYKPLGEVA